MTNLLNYLEIKFYLKNQSILNIAASDYHFEDKKSFYLGEKRRDDSNKPSEISEIQDIIELPDFREEQIIERNNNILNKFFVSLKEENILD